LLAALLVLHRRDNIDFSSYSSKLKFERDALVRRFGQDFALQGSMSKMVWVPAGWMSDARVRAFLWIETRRAIIADSPYAADISFLAAACDPERESIPAAHSIPIFHGPAQKRIAEILAAPESLKLQRASWLPPQCYLAHASRLQEDVRALFTE